MAIRHSSWHRSSTSPSCFASSLHSFAMFSLLDTTPMLASLCRCLHREMQKCRWTMSHGAWTGAASSGPLDCEGSTFHSLSSFGSLGPYPCLCVAAQCLVCCIFWIRQRIFQDSSMIFWVWKKRTASCMIQNPNKLIKARVITNVLISVYIYTMYLISVYSYNICRKL